VFLIGVWGFPLEWVFYDLVVIRQQLENPSAFFTPLFERSKSGELNKTIMIS